MIKDIDESSFSNDYELLVKLMQRRSVVCVVDYNANRDVAKTRYGDGVFEVGARGIGYIWAETKKEFIEQCKEYNLKFLP